MHILITDSGVGGLSVVAYAEKFVRTHGWSEPVRLTFANAATANDYGYNSMPTKKEKLRTFDRFLRNVTERFAPDSIYVACNTLSVLLPETRYFAESTIPVRGILETGVDLLRRELETDPRTVAIIFATQTTTDSGAYPRRLQAGGLARSRTVSQACPGLADVISEDRDGRRAASEIRKWVEAAARKLESRDAPVIAALACTHYGYRKELFSAAFAEAGVRAKVVNPNEGAVGDLFPPAARSSPSVRTHEAGVEFVTKYALPEAAVETLTYFLRRISPRTVEAMQDFVHVPELF